MNDMYYNDCYNSEFMYEPYPINYNQCSTCEQNYRSSSSSSSVDRVDSFYNPAEGFAKGNMQANIYQPYKLTNPNLPPVYNERQRMLLEVQKYNFAMWDLNLYLNTHPNDRNVMMLFEQNKVAYKRAKENYEMKFGPLCFENTSTNSGYWEWNKSPWPWEGE